MTNVVGRRDTHVRRQCFALFAAVVVTAVAVSVCAVPARAAASHTRFAGTIYELQARPFKSNGWTWRLSADTYGELEMSATKMLDKGSDPTQQNIWRFEGFPGEDLTSDLAFRGLPR